MAQTVKIVQAGDPVLRAVAAPLTAEQVRSPEVQRLLETMVATMRAAPGVGLAAPQIGVGSALVVLEDREELMARLSPGERRERERTPLPLTTIANPVLTVVDGGGRAAFFEGCLSVTGYMALVERHLEVEVTGLDANGEPLRLRARGWPARILQHEVDHLGGTLYVDRMLSRSFASNEEVMRRWLSTPVAEVRAALRT